VRGSQAPLLRPGSHTTIRAVRPLNLGQGLPMPSGGVGGWIQPLRSGTISPAAPARRRACPSRLGRCLRLIAGDLRRAAGNGAGDHQLLVVRAGWPTLAASGCGTGAAKTLELFGCRMYSFAVTRRQAAGFVAGDQLTAAHQAWPVNAWCPPQGCYGSPPWLEPTPRSGRNPLPRTGCTVVRRPEAVLNRR